MICLLYARVEQNRCTGSYWVAIGSPCRVEVVPRSSGWELPYRGQKACDSGPSADSRAAAANSYK